MRDTFYCFSLQTPRCCPMSLLNNGFLIMRQSDVRKAGHVFPMLTRQSKDREGGHVVQMFTRQSDVGNAGHVFLNAYATVSHQTLERLVIMSQCLRGSQTSERLSCCLNVYAVIRRQKACSYYPNKTSKSHLERQSTPYIFKISSP